MVSRMVSRLRIMRRVAVWEGGSTYQLCLQGKGMVRDRGVRWRWSDEGTTKGEWKRKEDKGRK